MSTGFTHLANPNYSAAYYTYMWSLVISKDLFGQFDVAVGALGHFVPAVHRFDKAAQLPRPLATNRAARQKFAPTVQQ